MRALIPLEKIIQHRGARRVPPRHRETDAYTRQRRRRRLLNRSDSPHQSKPLALFIARHKCRTLRADKNDIQVTGKRLYLTYVANTWRRQKQALDSLLPPFLYARVESV